MKMAHGTCPFAANVTRNVSLSNRLALTETDPDNLLLVERNSTRRQCLRADLSFSFLEEKGKEKKNFLRERNFSLVIWNLPIARGSLACAIRRRVDFFKSQRRLPR